MSLINLFYILQTDSKIKKLLNWNRKMQIKNSTPFQSFSFFFNKNSLISKFLFSIKFFLFIQWFRIYESKHSRVFTAIYYFWEEWCEETSHAINKVRNESEIGFIFMSSVRGCRTCWDEKWKLTGGPASWMPCRTCCRRIFVHHYASICAWQALMRYQRLSRIPVNKHNKSGLFRCERLGTESIEKKDDVRRQREQADERWLEC